MLDAVIAAVKAVAQQEILPRYLKVARQRKADGSLFTEADLATQETFRGNYEKSIRSGGGRRNDGTRTGRSLAGR